MSIVIIGGHDRMVRQYETICKTVSYTHLTLPTNSRV